MKSYTFFILLLTGLLFCQGASYGQLLPPNQPEQDACNALLVCGNSFTSPYGYQGIGQVSDLSSTPCGGGEGNTMWLRLEITSPGIIVFEIQPIITTDDYDFTIVDITNSDCQSFTINDVIRCNFNNNTVPGSNVNGIIGLNTTSTIQYVYSGTTGSSYLQQITANTGDVYLIMVNNFGTGFSGPVSGFTIDFTGSTATFNQAPAPKLDKIVPSCNYSQEMTVILTENAVCGSIAPDGSDFYLSPGGTIQSIDGVNCTGTSGYTDELKLTFNGVLPNGDYVLHAQTGSDGNTLLGLCDAALVLPDSLTFHVGNDPLVMTGIDSPACQTLTIHVDAPGACNTIAADGSDFVITGPSAVSVVSATGVGCSGASDYTQTIQLELDQPIAVDGLYHVKVQTGTDGNTFSDSCGRVLSVDATIPFVVQSYNGQLTAYPDDTLICNVGTVINLSGTNSGVAPDGGFQYEWTPAAGITNPQSLNTTAAIQDSFSTYVLATVDSNGCYLRDSINITAQEFHAAFDFDVSFGCEKDTVHFTNMTTPGAVGYYWDFGDGLIDTTFEPTHYYDQGGYMVMLTATNGYCMDSVLHSVSLYHPLEAAFDMSDDTVCLGTSISFINQSTATSSGGIDPTYLWDFGDGSPQETAANPSHLYTSPGSYRVMLVARNFIPCQDTIYHMVQVDSLPAVSLTASDREICMGDKITFTADYIDDGLEGLIWNFGYNDDVVRDLNPVTTAYDEPGTYTVTLNADYGACSDSAISLEVTVNPLPYINLGPDTTLCLQGSPIVLADRGNLGNPLATWLWNTGDTTASIVVRHDGIYSATVTVDNCSAEDRVTVSRDCYIDIPNSFTPNNDGYNDYFFPRQLLANGVISFNMSIYNRWGEKVFETNNIQGRGWDGRFNDQVQPVGVYIYQIDIRLKNQETERYSGNVTLLR